MIIQEVKAKKIFNSRNEATIEVSVKSDERMGVGSAPSGASKGKKEVEAFPRGIDSAVEFVNNILTKDLSNFEFKEFNDFKKIEKIISKYDKTKNLSKIGGNLVIALEFAVLNCFEKPWHFLNKEAKSVPRSLGNCIGGGKHANNGTTFQEFLLISLDSKDMSKSIEANKEIHKLVRKKFGFFSKVKKDYEGAWAPDMDEIEILELLGGIIRKVSQKYDFNIKIGIDVAANSLWDGKNYVYKDIKRTKEEHIDYLISLVEKYNLVYLEDPVEENDSKGFKEISDRIKQRCLVSGDDLVCSNPIELKKNIKNITAVICKPNQIGSLVKFKELIELAKKNKITPVISHRAGETLDTTIADLAVGFGIPIIKTGISGREREIKLERIIEIQKEIKALNKK